MTDRTIRRQYVHLWAWSFREWTTYVVIALAVVGAAYIAGSTFGGDHAEAAPPRTITTVREVKVVPLTCIEAMDDAESVVFYSVDALTIAADGLAAFVDNRPEAAGQKLQELTRAMTPVTTAIDDYQVNSKECRRA